MSPRPRWTFITNHGAVLTMVGEREQITACEIAKALGITERTVRQIIADLEREGYIEKQRVGRSNRYYVNRKLPLRRQERRDVAVGELLRILSSEIHAEEEVEDRGDGGRGT